MALNHIAAAIIAFRKVTLRVNIIFGSVLRQGRAVLTGPHALIDWQLPARLLFLFDLDVKLKFEVWQHPQLVAHHRRHAQP